MLTVEFPSGSILSFDSHEAPARAQIRAGTPLTVRDERDGTKQVLWAPEDFDN